ncbi:acyltransferase domain-containing protein [Actinomycetes bacterium KLBMP 9797]
MTTTTFGDPRLLFWSAAGPHEQRRREALRRLLAIRGEAGFPEVVRLCTTRFGGPPDESERPATGAPESHTGGAGERQTGGALERQTAGAPEPRTRGAGERPVTSVTEPPARGAGGSPGEEVRGAVVAAGAAEAMALLDGHRAASPPRRPVALLIPGQGAQYRAMATGLYGHEPGFTDALDAAFAALGDRGRRLRAEWLAADPDVPWDDGSRAQPLLFAVGYALGAMVVSWGVRPAAVLGHSVGELVSAVLAGIFSLADAARLMGDRIDAVAATPAGGMLAVAAPAARLAPYVEGAGGDVAVAAVNAPRQTLLAGPERSLSIVEARLRADGFTVRRAKARQAFHSPVMRAAGAATAGTVRAAAPRAPSWSFYSGYAGGPLAAETARDPGFWANQLTDPVLFWPALDALLASGPHLLVEAGPGQGLTAIARAHPAVRSRHSDVVPLLPARHSGPAADRRAVCAAAARLWLEGHPLRWPTGGPASGRPDTPASGRPASGRPASGRPDTPASGSPGMPASGRPDIAASGPADDAAREEAFRATQRV